MTTPEQLTELGRVHRAELAADIRLPGARGFGRGVLRGVFARLGVHPAALPIAGPHAVGRSRTNHTHPRQENVMSRIQLALNVNDLNASIPFYSSLLGAEPAKVRPGYANFALTEPPLKLVLIEKPGEGGTLNHLGVEVDDTDAVNAAQARLADAGLATLDERGTTCCYAKQDKFWVEGAPDAEEWEIYTVLADSATFADRADADACCTPANTEARGADDADAACCDGTPAASAPAKACC